jgi:hypothetical protein
VEAIALNADADHDGWTRNNLTCPRTGMNGSGLGSASTSANGREPSAAMPFDDIDHQHAANDPAPRKLVGRGAPDADLGHELGGAFVLDSRHALAGVDHHAVTDGGAVGADGGTSTKARRSPTMLSRTGAPASRRRTISSRRDEGSPTLSCFSLIGTTSAA